MNTSWLFVVLLAICLLWSCKKDPPAHPNAEIYRFNPQKCMCCWGWYVQRDSDTFKIDQIPQGVQLSTQITAPIRVYIETGAERGQCTLDYRYLEVNKLIVFP